MGMNHWTGLWMVAALLLTTGGCSSYRTNVASPEVAHDLLPFLENGKTRRDEIQKILGNPSFESERDRVIAYRVAPDGLGSLESVVWEGTFGWKRTQYNLVLAFNAEQILEKHALIQMKENAP
jgi:hypothetical protein